MMSLLFFIELYRLNSLSLVSVNITQRQQILYNVNSNHLMALYPGQPG